MCKVAQKDAKKNAQLNLVIRFLEIYYLAMNDDGSKIIAKNF